MVESVGARLEREFIAESDRIRKGGGCWLLNESGRCQGPESCLNCAWYNDFYNVVHSYQETPGITVSEALWLACQYFDIKTEYMCNGQEESWLAEHQPEKRKEALKRQAELMGDPVEEKKEKAVVGAQMTIEEYINESKY